MAVTEGRVSCSIDGIDDSHNNHSYDEAEFLKTEESLRRALLDFWQTGARVANVEEVVARAFNEELGG